MSDKYQDVGYGSGVIEFGDRPAVVVVDFQLAFTDPRYPLGGLPMVNSAVERTAELLQVARQQHVPVAKCFTAYDSPRDVPFWKVAAVHEDFYFGHPCTAMDPRIDEPDYDFNFAKSAPSIFFATPLTTFLHKERVDSVIVTGCTTSGCVRASVVDAFSHGYRVFVPVDCVGDVDDGPHRANLSDVGKRYCELTDAEALMEWFRGSRGVERRA
ncbi:MAG: isochorismatase family protein [Gammaproteobacteria bacterium]|jgi:maleamate amidohydrolase